MARCQTCWRGGLTAIFTKKFVIRQWDETGWKRVGMKDTLEGRDGQIVIFEGFTVGLS